MGSSEPAELAILSKAAQQLASCRDLRTVKEIRDKAEAIRSYLKASTASLNSQNAAAEIRLRAERRMGELLAGMGEKRGRPKKGQRDSFLQGLGIDGNQSKRYQREARIPKDEFERHLIKIPAARGELTTVGLLRLEASLRRERRNGELESITGIADTLEKLAEGRTRFGTIYADPPWQYGNQATRAATDNHYPTMTVDDIAALPVASVAAETAHLHLWTTNAFLFEAHKVLGAWGFAYKSVFVWVKPQMGIGNYWRVSHEFLLLGVRGACPFADHNLMSWSELPRGRHSRKPDEVRAMIERASPNPRLELFARAQFDGWLVLGNEIDKTIFDAV